MGRIGHSLRGQSQVGASNNNAKLVEDDVREIFRLYSQGVSTRKISERYPIVQSRVVEILYRRAWIHVEVPTEQLKHLEKRRGRNGKNKEETVLCSYRRKSHTGHKRIGHCKQCAKDRENTRVVYDPESAWAATGTFPPPGHYTRVLRTPEERALVALGTFF